MVGAASWGADGLPQEVGGIIWADGEVWNHGRGFPPEHWFALDYERQSDYVSGCALAIRRSLWQQLEGFDPRYRPAYCEDTDLCLRVWEAGQTVLVEPQARILHLEGLSHSRSTAGGLKAHQLSNLQVLRQRWQERLDLQQPPKGMPWLLAADRGLLGRPLAVLLLPEAEAMAQCQQRGWASVPLESQLPLEWLVQHLAGALVPEVGLVGKRQSAPGIPANWLRLQTAADLPQRPLDEQPLMPSLPGWERPDLRLLASSSGLHRDGWLETPSRLVLQLLGQPSTAGGLLLQLYLPEAEQQPGAAGAATVQLKFGSEGPALSWPLQPALNRLELALPAQGRSCLVLELQGTKREQPLEGHDQRRLLAVLSDLSVVEGSLGGLDVEATASPNR